MANGLGVQDLGEVAHVFDGLQLQGQSTAADPCARQQLVCVFFKTFPPSHSVTDMAKYWLQVFGSSTAFADSGYPRKPGTPTT